MKRTAFSLSGVFLAAMVLFDCTLDAYHYLHARQIWVGHSGFEPAALHPLAVWAHFTLDGTCLAIVLLVVGSAMRRRAKRLR